MARPLSADQLTLTLNPAGGCNLPANSALMGDERACLARIYDTMFVRLTLTAQGLATMNLTEVVLFSHGVTESPNNSGLSGSATNWRVRTLDEDGAPHSCLVYRATGLAVEIASPMMVASVDTSGLIVATVDYVGGEEVAAMVAKNILESYTLQLRRKSETCSYQFGNIIQWNGESDVFGYKAISNAFPQLSWTREFSCCILFPAGTRNTKPLTLVLTPNPDVVGSTVRKFLGTAQYAAASAAALAAGVNQADGTAFEAGDSVVLTMAIRMAPLGYFDETIPNPGLCGPEPIDIAQLQAALAQMGYKK